jgi:dTDP-4-amino-4,6-dideoxygalactose transaminase
MTNNSVKIPFVDLTIQHQPLQSALETAIQQVLQRGDFVLGRAVTEFESAFAAACGVSYGIGVGCGTDAIALGLQACGIKAGDEVILPTNTFVATLIGVVRAGAKPILVDCDAQTALIDLEAAEKAITPQTKAIVPVHLYGQLVSPEKLLAIAKKYNLIIFEDAAQAHLAEREGYRAGSIGKAAAFSFYPSKNLGAFGSGGMVVTNDEAVAKKMKTLRNYGAPKKYLHTELGTNSRLDTIQAAILNVKLPHLEAWNRQRNQAAAQYDRLLKPLQEYGIIPMQNQCDAGHVYHLYVVRILDRSPCDRQTIAAQLEDLGIQTGIHYPLPCHLQPAFEYLGYKKGDFPQAEALSEQILSLPMYPGLSQTQVSQVVLALEKLVAATPAKVISR